METEILNKTLENKEIIQSEYFINEDLNCQIYFHRTLSDIKLFNQFYLSKINESNFSYLDKVYPGVYFKITTIDEDINLVINSGLILMIIKINNIKCLYKINTQNGLNRAIQDSLIEPSNIIGSRDGFIESLDTNIALIQKRIKSSTLQIDYLNTTTRGKNNIAILYINDITNKETLNIIKEKLNNLNTDSISSINDISYLFSKNHLFPLCSEVGNPDLCSTCLLEGRVAIIVDNIPIAIILPVDFNYFITLKENHFTNPILTFYYRVLFTVLLFLSVFFLGIYVSLINYHSEVLSLIVISQIKASFQGSTLPLIIEFVFILFLFDTLRLASTKSPSNNIQNVIIIVGGLLIGQNAVDSGFISAFNLVITAICYLSSYAISNNPKFIQALSLLRLIVFFCGVFLGIYGVVLASIIILYYLSKTKSLKVNYTHPLIPFHKKDFKQMFLSKRVFKYKTRNKNLDNIDNTRGL